MWLLDSEASRDRKQFGHRPRKLQIQLVARPATKLSGKAANVFAAFRSTANLARIYPQPSLFGHLLEVGDGASLRLALRPDVACDHVSVVEDPGATIFHAPSTFANHNSVATPPRR